jgi:GNAT superfamily N-acetyltransferase
VDGVSVVRRLSTIYDMLAVTGLPDPVTIDGPRPAVPADVPEVVALVDAAMRAGTEQTLLTDYPLVYDVANLRNVRVLRVSGELASVVPVLPREAVLAGRRIRIGIISPTATAPAHRHRGHASRCLASAIVAMADADCALSVLWTMVETFPFYEHAGYHPVAFQGDAVTLDGGDADAFPADPAIAIETLDPTDDATLDAIRRFHDADGGGEGIRRDARETGALFALPRMRTLVARRGGAVAGYLLVGEAINKPGLIEAGGDEVAIATLLRAALAALPDGATIDAPLLRAPTVLADVLERAVPGRRRVVTDGLMVRINDIERVLGRPGPVELDRKAWAAALFGSHPARPTPAIPGLAERLDLPLPLSITIPVLDRS